MLVPDSPSDDDSSSEPGSPVLGHRHTHRHHHSHSHFHSHAPAQELPTANLNTFSAFTDTSTTSFSVQQAIANSIAEHSARSRHNREQNQAEASVGAQGPSGEDVESEPQS